MVGLVQGFPLATQPIINMANGLVERSWLNFFQSLWGNASQTTLPAGVTLPPGSVDLAAFAPFLNPVGLAPDGLPDPNGYTGPAVVFSSDGNLYRYVNGAWTLAVPAAAIVGQIPLGAIPQIPTTQLTGYVQAAQIQANSIGVDQISAGYIYAGNITASQITAGTLGAGVILTSFLSAGQINTGTLTGITITGNTINGNTITGGTITGATLQTTGGVGSSSAGIQISSGASGGFAGYNTTPDLTVAIAPTGTAFLMFTDNLNGLGGGNYVALCASSTPGFRASGNTLGTFAFQADNGGLKIVDSSPISMGGGLIQGISGIQDASGNSLVAAGSGNVFLGNSSHLVLTNTHIAGGAANTFTCGTAGLPWSGGFTQTAFTVTSDGTLKDEVEGAGLGLPFINALRPMAGKWKDGPEGIHQWLIAQEVAEALCGAPFAGLHKPAGKDEHWGIIYEEFIPPMIKAIQELSAEIAGLKQAP